MIVGFSGKKGSGKDLCGMIWQALIDKPDTFDKMTVVTEEDVIYKVWDAPTFINIKFADKLKDMVCILLGCTRDRLEDRAFKETPLPEIWWRYKKHDGSVFRFVPKEEYDNHEDDFERFIQKTTPRLLLQLMGTECGRQILHPNLWVNAVMSNYKPSGYLWQGDDKIHKEKLSALSEPIYPNWIITDVRFDNELKAVKERGISIRVNRTRYENEGEEFYAIEDGNHVWFDNRELGNVSFTNSSDSKEKSLQNHREMVGKDMHPSETSLDDAEFDYTIVNDGTIKDLVEKIKEIIIINNNI
jgi:hypothetical protein